PFLRPAVDPRRPGLPRCEMQYTGANGVSESFVVGQPVLATQGIEPQRSRFDQDGLRGDPSPMQANPLQPVCHSDSISGILETTLKPLHGELDAFVLKVLVDEGLDLVALHCVFAAADLPPIRGPIDVPAALMTCTEAA